MVRAIVREGSPGRRSETTCGIRIRFVKKVGFEPGAKERELWMSRVPGLRLPSRPQSITDPWPVPSYTAWWQSHTGVNNLPKVVTQHQVILLGGRVTQV